MSTRIEALTNAINGTLTEEDREVLQKMVNSLAKRKKQGLSEKAVENKKLAVELVRAMRDNGLSPEELITTAWVMEHLNGVRTGQKAAKILSVAIENGDIEREYIKSRPFYHLAA